MKEGWREGWCGTGREGGRERERESLRRQYAALHDGDERVEREGKRE